ncbi:uncharacterized protein LOC125502047 [Athalia rosae]|uniref:uncharacterized protein LOC125502047 n=1 Tax=Athalia rosae TaxID=37344 RepID=UPI0020346A28|nr:uncharacterized protein LOC125502047 [Athalia rosae]
MSGVEFLSSSRAIGLPRLYGPPGTGWPFAKIFLDPYYRCFTSAREDESEKRQEDAEQEEEEEEEDLPKKSQGLPEAIGDIWCRGIRSPVVLFWTSNFMTSDWNAVPKKKLLWSVRLRGELASYSEKRGSARFSIHECQKKNGEKRIL